MHISLLVGILFPSFFISPACNSFQLTCWAPDTLSYLFKPSSSGDLSFLGSIGLPDTPHAHHHPILWASVLPLGWDCLGYFIFSGDHLGRCMCDPLVSADLSFEWLGTVLTEASPWLSSLRGSLGSMCRGTMRKRWRALVSSSPQLGNSMVVPMAPTHTGFLDNKHCYWALTKHYQDLL